MSDNSSMQSVYNRIQNLRQSILNQDDRAVSSQPIIASQKKPTRLPQNYNEQEQQRGTPSPSLGIDLSIPLNQMQTTQTNPKVELSPMMYSIGNESHAGTGAKQRRQSIENSSIENNRRRASQERDFEAKIRQEMEQKLQERLSQIDQENRRGSDHRYQELQGRFDHLLQEFNKMKSQMNSAQNSPQVIQQQSYVPQPQQQHQKQPPIQQQYLSVPQQQQQRQNQNHQQSLDTQKPRSTSNQNKPQATHHPDQHQAPPFAQQAQPLHQTQKQVQNPHIHHDTQSYQTNSYDNRRSNDARPSQEIHPQTIQQHQQYQKPVQAHTQSHEGHQPTQERQPSHDRYSKQVPSQQHQERHPSQDRYSHQQPSYQNDRQSQQVYPSQQDRSSYHRQPSLGQQQHQLSQNQQSQSFKSLRQASSQDSQSKQLQPRRSTSGQKVHPESKIGKVPSLPQPRSGRNNSKQNSSLYVPEKADQHSVVLPRRGSHGSRGSRGGHNTSGSQQNGGNGERSNQDINYTFTESEVQKLEQKHNMFDQPGNMDEHEKIYNQTKVSTQRPMTTGKTGIVASPEQTNNPTNQVFSSFEADSVQQIQPTTNLDKKSSHNSRNNMMMTQNQTEGGAAPHRNSAGSLPRHQSSKSLVALRSTNNLLSLDLVQIPELPKPVQTYTSLQDQQAAPTPKPLHTKRFKCDVREKLDVRKIDYPSVDKVNYFANKEDKKRQAYEQKKKDMPSDKRIIHNLEQKIKSMTITNKKLKNELDFTKERLLKEGGQACCCQELKKVTQHKNQQMLNIIEIWKKKASEQGNYWQKEIRDLKQEHQRTENFSKKRLQELEAHMQSVFGLIINKQQDLELSYAARLKSKDKDNRELTRRVVQHRHALVQLRLNDL